MADGLPQPVGGADRRWLPALLQLASAGLPIGGYCYSSGLEAAVEHGLVHDAASATRWLRGQLLKLWARGEARIWPALYRAWQAFDEPALQRWNERLLALRDSAELRLETTQTGRSLALWLLQLPGLDALDQPRRALLAGLQPLCHPVAHAAAAWSLGLDLDGGLHALGWSLLESQAGAAVRLVPLGQSAGQQLLHALGAELPAAIALAQSEPPERALGSAPMLAVLSARHETQYSRLFRS